ncbi:MAG: hypothetical protein C4337_03525 [Armatimonadota bacterium]
MLRERYNSHAMGTVLIIGADSTIGQSVTKAFIEDEWHVYAIGRHPERFANGVHFQYALSDASDANAISQAYEMLRTYLNRNPNPPIDGMVYTVGDITARKVTEMDAATWRRILPGLSAYACAKAGLETFAQVLAKENPRWRVTVVRPAAVATRFWERVPFRMPANALDVDSVALRILEAYYNEHRGNLDILPA